MSDHTELPRAEQRTRKALARAVASDLKLLARGSGWRMAQGWMFREQADWFIQVQVGVPLNRARTTLALTQKPMGLDPMFWDIVGLPENGKQPLSFRVFGAWTCPVPASVEAELLEGDGQAEGIARAVLDWADAQLVETVSSRELNAFIEYLRGHPRRGHYLASYITALVLAHRRDEALAESTVAMDRGESAGFSVGTTVTFPELARRWLISGERDRTLS
jgi:hypothetical protein